MTSNALSRSHHFDFENVRNRLSQRQRETKTPPIPARAPGKRPVPQLAPRPAPQTRGFVAQLAVTARDDSTQLAAASLILAGFALWLAFSAQDFYARHNEIAFAWLCHDNQLNTAGGGLCFDGRRQVYRLNDQGGAARLALDWKINERVYRQAEAAAVRQAKGIPAP